MHYVTIHQAGQWDDISHSESGLYCGQLGRETTNSKESTYREPVLHKNQFSIPIPTLGRSYFIKYADTICCTL